MLRSSQYFMLTRIPRCISLCIFRQVFSKYLCRRDFLSWKFIHGCSVALRQFPSYSQWWLPSHEDIGELSDWQLPHHFKPFSLGQDCSDELFSLREFQKEEQGKDRVWVYNLWQPIHHEELHPHFHPTTKWRCHRWSWPTVGHGESLPRNPQSKKTQGHHCDFSWRESWGGGICEDGIFEGQMSRLCGICGFSGLHTKRWVGTVSQLPTRSPSDTAREDAQARSELYCEVSEAICILCQT